MDNDESPLITRKAGVELAREKLGIPISIWTVNRAAVDGTGPKPVAKYGNKQDLYRPAEFLKWARSLVVKPNEKDGTDSIPTKTEHDPA